MTMHCNRALCGTIHTTCTRSTANGYAVSIAGLPAYAPTCTWQHKSHKDFCRAALAHAWRAAARCVDLGGTSTLELACDAGTPGTISAGDLGRCGAQANLLFSRSPAASQRALQEATLLTLSCSVTFEFSSRNLMVGRPLASCIQPCACGTQRTDGRDERGTKPSI